MAYIINKNECVACGTCITVCPKNAISEGGIFSINPDICKECGSCEEVCPTGAIILAPSKKPSVTPTGPTGPQNDSTNIPTVLNVIIKCPTCGKTFDAMQEDLHGGQLMYHCDACGSNFQVEFFDHCPNCHINVGFVNTGSFADDMKKLGIGLAKAAFNPLSAVTSFGGFFLDAIDSSVKDCNGDGVCPICKERFLRCPTCSELTVIARRAIFTDKFNCKHCNQTILPCSSIRPGKERNHSKNFIKFLTKEDPNALYASTEKIYDDGSIYQGQIAPDGQRSGKGRMTFANGDIYEGEFKNDSFQGYGVLTLKAGARFECNWVDGKISGEGIYYGSDGSKLEAIWQEDSPISGTYHYAGGAIYKGSLNKEWHRHGQGIVLMPDGSKIEASWEDNAATNAIVTFVNGVKYQGKLNTDLENDGFGIQIMPDGSKYEGSWKAGVRWGMGSFSLANGSKIEGIWEQDEPKSGIMTLDNGDQYEGSFKNFEEHGFGTLSYANGEKFTGTWECGCPINGTWFYNNGDRYEGCFKDWKREGYGTYYWSDGTKHIGEWSDNKRHGRGRYYAQNGDHKEGEWHFDIFKEI